MYGKDNTKQANNIFSHYGPSIRVKKGKRLRTIQ